MKGNNSIQARRWIPSPSLTWLFFLPSFSVMAVEMSQVAVGILFGATLLLFLTYAFSSSRIWKPYFYIPIGILLLSTHVSYLWFPWVHIWWSWVAILLSALWIVFSTRSLEVEYAYKFAEWLFTARIIILASVIGLVGLALAGLLQPPYDAVWHGWVPIGALILVFFTHEIRMHKIMSELPHLTRCPKDTPLIRIAILHGDRIWLTRTPYTGCYSKEPCDKPCHKDQKLDHPFTTCQLPGETVDEAVQRIRKDSKLRFNDITPKHLISYTCERGQVRHLHVLNLKQRWPAGELSLRGRFYSLEEIEQLRHRDLLDLHCAEEYQYLKNTLVVANRLRNKV